MQNELDSNKGMLDNLNEQLAINLLQTVQTASLKELHKGEIITTKLHVILNKELNNW